MCRSVRTTWQTGEPQVGSNLNAGGSGGAREHLPAENAGSDTGLMSDATVGAASGPRAGAGAGDIRKEEELSGSPQGQRLNTAARSGLEIERTARERALAAGDAVIGAGELALC